MKHVGEPRGAHQLMRCALSKADPKACGQWYGIWMKKGQNWLLAQPVGMRVGTRNRSGLLLVQIWDVDRSRPCHQSEFHSWGSSQTDKRASDKDQACWISARTREPDETRKAATKPGFKVFQEKTTLVDERIFVPTLHMNRQNFEIKLFQLNLCFQTWISKCMHAMV